MIMLANAERLGWEAIASALDRSSPPLKGESMKLFRDLIRSKEPTASDLRTALAELPIGVAAEALAMAEARYRSQLLDGADAPAIERTQREISEARTECDRLRIFGEELSAKLAAAIERERIEVLKSRAASAEKGAAAASEAFTTRYDAIVRELVGMFDQLAVAEVEAEETNKALREGGVPMFVPPAEGRIRTRLSLVPGRHLHRQAKHSEASGSPGSPFGSVA